MNGKRMEGFRSKKNYDTQTGVKRALREKEKKKMEREKEGITLMKKQEGKRRQDRE